MTIVPTHFAWNSTTFLNIAFVALFAAMGGFEVAMMVGLMLSASARRFVIIPDGLPACAALLAASALAGTFAAKSPVVMRLGRAAFMRQNDLDYRRNVTAMRDAVAATGLHILGRFAQFDYINSDVCVERALALASELRHE